MKVWMITLPLACAIGAAMAGEVDKDQAAGQPQAAAAAPKARHGMHRAMTRRLPHGDLRACLERKSNEAITRCAESRHKR